jgi:hypothetical protein
MLKIVWEKLEKQNPEYFRLYNLRILIKSQMEFFNDIAYLMKEPEKVQSAVTSLITNFAHIETPSPSSGREKLPSSAVHN